MNIDKPNSDFVLSPTHQRGRRLLLQGVVIYFLLSFIPVIAAILNPGFGLVFGFFLAACILVAPLMAWRGSEGWKIFAGVVALLLAMGTFLGGCTTIQENTSFGVVSFAVFACSSYLVNIFMINQKVKDYVASLREQRRVGPQPPPTPPTA